MMSALYKAPAVTRRIAALALVLPLGWLAACSTSEKKGGGSEVSSSGGGGGGGGGGSKGDTPSSNVSSNRVTLSNSWSNNPLTSQTISKSKADSQASSLSSAKDKRGLEGKIAADRLAGKSSSQVLATAKRLADLEMAKTQNKDIDAEVRLDIALAAVNSRNYSLAYYLLDDIMSDKKASNKVKAGAYNAMGVIALKDDRVPEAVLYFRQALKEVGNYRPALLNLGFAALKGGDMATAKRSLGSMQSDWFVQYGMISIERVEGNTGRASDLCDRVLKSQPSHKAALFNCGLVEYQNKKRFKEAAALVNKAGKARGGESGWDERISQMETRIDQDAARERASQAKPASKPQGNDKNAPKPK